MLSRVGRPSLPAVARDTRIGRLRSRTIDLKGAYSRYNLPGGPTGGSARQRRDVETERATQDDPRLSGRGGGKRLDYPDAAPEGRRSSAAAGSEEKGWLKRVNRYGLPAAQQSGGTMVRHHGEAGSGSAIEEMEQTHTVASDPDRAA